jgi:Na+/melibiose symporter-like transporter
LQTLIPYYMKDFFNYGDVQTSFMYMASGIECLMMLVILIFLSRVVYDWVLHLVGLLLLTLGFVVMVAIVPQFEPGKI